MINRDNILPLISSLLSYLRIHQNTPTERILASMILHLTSTFLLYPRRAKNRDHPSPLADINPLLRGLVRPHDVRHPRRVQEVLNRLVPIANRSRASLALPEPRVV